MWNCFGWSFGGISGEIVGRVPSLTNVAPYGICEFTSISQCE